MPRFSQEFCGISPSLKDFVDPVELDGQADLLTASGLQRLNDKLLAADAQVFDVLAEHNVGALLVRCGFRDLEHEPPSLSRPVDFVGRRAATAFYAEVKRIGEGGAGSRRA